MIIRFKGVLQDADCPNPNNIFANSNSINSKKDGQCSSNFWNDEKYCYISCNEGYQQIQVRNLYIH